MRGINIVWLLAVAILPILANSNVYSAYAQGTAGAVEPRYLAFQLFTAGPGFTTEFESTSDFAAASGWIARKVSGDHSWSNWSPRKCR